MKVMLNFGCGSNHLKGWDNHDMDVDIRNPLPYPDGHADFIFAEHVVEHVTPQEAYKFFEECYRVLKPGGVVRISVPAFDKIFRLSTPAYLRWLEGQKWGDGTKKSAVKNIVFNHGHQAIWTGHLLNLVLASVGFRAREVPVSYSDYPELNDIEGHWRMIGREFNLLETCSVEGVKD